MTTKTNGKHADVDAATREVKRAERALTNDLHQASEAGEATLERALTSVKPMLIGVAVVGGVFWLLSRLIQPKRRQGWRPLGQRSLVSEVVRAAALSLAAAAARRVGDQFLTAPSLPAHSTPTRRAATPQATAPAT